MNILIAGSNGQLGTALKEKYPEAIAVDYDQLDITNEDSVDGFDWENIDVIINAAAYTNVDGAETDEGRIAAWKVNAEAVGNLAKIARQKNIVLIHISTDYVFDGTKDNHTETESFSPLSVYGASKAAGDLLAATAAKHYIIRTSWVIGEGKNFVRTMIELGKKGVEPKVVSDQIGRLTFTNEIARAIDHLLSNMPDFGTYNVSNAGDPSSWADITRQIFSIAKFDLSVTDTSTNEYYSGKAGIAPRPLLSTLSLDKIANSGFGSTSWEDDLAKYVAKETES
jgi:dTDP-4-dehydrorhamnose 3,5-epimerase